MKAGITVSFYGYSIWPGKGALLGGFEYQLVQGLEAGLDL
jgi:hypothetical protein